MELKAIPTHSNIVAVPRTIETTKKVTSRTLFFCTGEGSTSRTNFFVREVFLKYVLVHVQLAMQKRCTVYKKHNPYTVHRTRIALASV